MGNRAMTGRELAVIGWLLAEIVRLEQIALYERPRQ